MKTHKHRIIPGHMGGTYNSQNVIEVEVNSCTKNNISCHSIWHYCNWKLWGRKEDYCAWRGLAGFAGKEEIIQKLHKEGIARGLETNKRQKTGPFNPELRSLGGKAAIASRIESDPDYQSRCGTLGGLKCKTEKIGFCGWSFEERAEQGRKNNAVKYYDPDHPELGHRTASALHRMQTKRGYPNQKQNRLKVPE
jgi:hypothetical protein